MLIGFFQQNQTAKERKWLFVSSDVSGAGTRNEPYERLRGRLERLQQLETCKGSCNCGIFCCPMYSIIVSTGDWLEKPANIKVQNNYAVVYVGSSLAVHNHLFFVYKL